MILLKELKFIHKCSIVGYRPKMSSPPLSHLIATNSSHFIIPFIPIRDHLPHFHYNFLHHIKFSSFIVFHNTHLIVYFKKFVKLNDIQTKTIQLVIFWNNTHIKLGTLNFPAATMVVCGGAVVVKWWLNM